MGALSLVGAFALSLTLLSVQFVAIALGRALRTYSRSRLAEVTAAHGRPARAEAIAHGDERTERAAESLGIAGGLTLAALTADLIPELGLGIHGWVAVVVAVSLTALSHVVASVVGRLYAETLLDALWPISLAVRYAAKPMTAFGDLAEVVAARLSRPEDVAPRPASVEVEYPPDAELSEEVETDVPSATRSMLEHVVALSLRDVSEIMTSRAAMVLLPASVEPAAAARVFSESGLSRIPLFGENRDDIVGILFAKDLFPAMTEAAAAATTSGEGDGDGDPVQPRKLARTPYFIPEAMAANDLLNEFRSRKIQIAIVLDEYGGVAGLVTLEDLIEELVGPIHDEHDREVPDQIVALGDGRFEVPSSTDLETINRKLGLHLPTDGDYETVGGLALEALGRLPALNETFEAGGVGFTVVEVVDHAVRRVRLETQGRGEPAAPAAGDRRD